MRQWVFLGQAGRGNIWLSIRTSRSRAKYFPVRPSHSVNKCILLTVTETPLTVTFFVQVTGLPHGLKGACLHTNLTKVQRQKVVEDLCSGKVSVLLLSPEALVGGSSGNGCLPSMSQLPQIAFACIDEAHCVSEWSHNFRPSYLRVCKVCFSHQCLCCHFIRLHSWKSVEICKLVVFYSHHVRYT